MVSASESQVSLLQLGFRGHSAQHPPVSQLLDANPAASRSERLKISRILRLKGQILLLSGGCEMLSVGVSPVSLKGEGRRRPERGQAVTALCRLKKGFLRGWPTNLQDRLMKA